MFQIEYAGRVIDKTSDVLEAMEIMRRHAGAIVVKVQGKRRVPITVAPNPKYDTRRCIHAVKQLIP
jgi:hypothetical protein